MSRRKLFESPEPSSQMLGVGPAYVSVEGLRQHLAEFLLYAGRPVVIMRGRAAKWATSCRPAAGASVTMIRWRPRPPTSCWMPPGSRPKTSSRWSRNSTRCANARVLHSRR